MESYVSYLDEVISLKYFATMTFHITHPYRIPAYRYLQGQFFFTYRYLTVPVFFFVKKPYLNIKILCVQYICMLLCNFLVVEMSPWRSNLGLN
jgi:hypothetical protein